MVIEKGRSQFSIIFVLASQYRSRSVPLSQKPWTQELTKIPDWPRRKAVAEFRLCIGHDRLGTHLHRTGIRPDPYCMKPPVSNVGQQTFTI